MKAMILDMCILCHKTQCFWCSDMSSASGFARIITIIIYYMHIAYIYIYYLILVLLSCKYNQIYLGDFTGKIHKYHVVSEMLPRHQEMCICRVTTFGHGGWSFQHRGRRLAESNPLRLRDDDRGNGLRWLSRSVESRAVKFHWGDALPPSHCFGDCRGTVKI